MPQRDRPAYPAEFPEGLVELVRSGRSPEDLSREFEPSAQAERDRGARSDGLTTAEREELRRLRRENKQLNIERAHLSGADITYVQTHAGLLYLAVVVDAWSRRVVGWSITNHLRTELVLTALEMALQQRLPADVIHHSDQGCQYTSYAFGKRCRQVGVRPSMGSVGDACDNAMRESFFATLQCELLDRRRFRPQTEARMAIFDFVEGWYNPKRRHSALDYISPLQFRTNQPQPHARKRLPVHRSG